MTDQPKRGYTRREPLQADDPMVGTGAEQATERPPVHASVRADDPRERARRRVAELTPQLDSNPEGGDRFAINPAVIPDGWAYEWKRDTLLGQRDAAYEVELARNGWEPVPASRHPHEMPVGWQGTTIQRDSMILMERPAQISERFRERDRRAARDQMRAKEEQLSGAPDGHFERHKSDGQSLARVKKSYSPVEIPSDV